MSGWGREVSLALTGTVAVEEDSASVVGTSTEFLTEVKGGEVIRISTVEYVVKSVESDTELTLEIPYRVATASGLSITLAEKPTVDKTKLVSDIYGVDAAEVGVTPGIAAPGWVHVKTIGSRTVYETLVAMKTPPVEDDSLDTSVFPNPTTTTTAAPTTTTTAAPTTTTTAEPTTTTTAEPTTTTTTGA